MLKFRNFIAILSNFKKIFCVENLYIEITDVTFSNVIHSTDYIACFFMKVSTNMWKNNLNNL